MISNKIYESISEINLNIKLEFCVYVNSVLKNNLEFN